MALFKQTVEYLESEQVQIKEVNVTETASKGESSKASFVVSVKNIFGWDQMKSTLQNKLGGRIAFDTDLAALSLIGEGLNRNNLILLEAFDLLTCQGIPVYGVTTTSFRVSFLVPRNHINNSVQLCHARWVVGNSI